MSDNWRPVARTAYIHGAGNTPTAARYVLTTRYTPVFNDAGEIVQCLRRTTYGDSTSVADRISAARYAAICADAARDHGAG